MASWDFMGLAKVAPGVGTQRVLSTWMVECRVSVIRNYYYGLGKYAPYKYLGPFVEKSPGC